MSAVHVGHSGTVRTRPDRCPGVLRPWPADDGGLVRIRVPGGRLSTGSLLALAAVAEEYGDARVRVTARANLQLRALPLHHGRLPEVVVAAIEATGLLPSRSHDLARNILCSPQTGRAGGNADLRPTVRALDKAICASAMLATLPGRFLFTLDDGRGDVRDRHRDLGLDVVGPTTARLRIGAEDGGIVALDGAATVLVGLAEEFIKVRGTGPSAAWHVDELSPPFLAGRQAAQGPCLTSSKAAVLLDVPQDAHSGPLAYGSVPGGEHVAVGPDGSDGIDGPTAAAWAARVPEVVITPWHGVLI